MSLELLVKLDSLIDLEGCERSPPSGSWVVERAAEMPSVLSSSLCPDGHSPTSSDS